MQTANTVFPQTYPSQKCYTTRIFIFQNFPKLDTLVFLKYIDKKVKFTAFKENLRIALSKPTALLLVK